MGKQIRSKSKKRQIKEEQQIQTKEQHNLDKQTLLSRQPDEQINYMRQLLNSIIVQPEAHIKKLDTVFILAKAQNVRVATTALRVLAEIFVGVAPLEAIDLKELTERRQVKITKQEFRVLRFEELLVGQYERYLKMLKEINMKLKAVNFSGDQQLFKEFKKCILHCLLKCFQTLWNFNHFKFLSQLMARFLKFKQCRDAVQQFLANKNTSAHKAKAKIIAEIASIIKEKPQSTLPDQLIKLINSSYIDSRYLEKQTQALKFRKKKFTKKLYKQQAFQRKKQKENKQAQKGTLQMKAKIKKEKAKQKLKVREEVEKQFAEGQATLSKKQLVKGNSAILQQIYYIYFKILVQRRNSKYLKDVLEGILNYAHLINIDLTSTLISHLDSANQSYRLEWLKNRNQNLLQCRLRLTFTAQSLLNGPLSVYNMDDLKASTSMFKILRDINTTEVALSGQIFKIITLCLQQILLKRRQLSQEVVATLLREIVIFLCNDQNPKLYLLELIRLVASKYSRISRMFEPDNEGYGLYGFNSFTLDPQATNAINTEVVTNLKALAKKAEKSKKLPKQIPELVQRFCRQNFVKSEQSFKLEDCLEHDLNLF